MARLLDDWLNRYVELMTNTEPALIFDKWTGFSVIAAALRRKVSLRLGRLIYYPNIYVVFVAEPGVARKTQAIKFGTEFLDAIPEIRVGSDSSTKEALTDDIELAANKDISSDGSDTMHCSLNIISKEFETFLGQKKENTRMLTALTDLYDCPDKWSARTRHSTSNEIVNPWLNLLAATTPDSLANSFPVSAIGGGLTSRMLFIWADRRKKSVAVPFMTEEEAILKDKLIKDLYLISRITGSYILTADTLRRWTEWYNSYDEDESGERICTDASFGGWYSRKPSTILKVSMLCAASESDSLHIKWHHIERAIEEIRQVELVMGNAFRAIGRSEISGEVDMVLQIIKTYKTISEKQLMSMVIRDIDSTKFDRVIDTLRKTGKVDRVYKGPNGEAAVWYKYIE